MELPKEMHPKIFSNFTFPQTHRKQQMKSINSNKRIKEKVPNKALAHVLPEI